MNLIKKIISWIKKIFSILFGKKKITKKVKKNINNAKNKRYLKGYGAFIEDSYNESFPLYLMITKEEKKKIIEKIQYIKNNIIDENEKEEINKVNTLITKIEKSEISFYQNSKINEKLDTLIDDRKSNSDIAFKFEKLNTEIFEIIDNFDENIKDKVIKEYKHVNYITVTTMLLDETKEELKELEENLKKHRFNRAYYDRELRKIKERIENLRKLRDSSDIQNEIYHLRKELYTKSKDKYDLLYNEEVFVNIEKECNDMLKKVNKRIIDIKKEEIKKEKSVNKDDKKEEKKKKEEEQELLENILKRFQDMELARKLLILNEDKSYQAESLNDLVRYMNKMYLDFLNGEKAIFNFPRNKTKTELVKLYNSINFLNCKLKDEEYIFIEHINYPLEDLLLATNNKKQELESILEMKYHYKAEKHEESILVNNKLTILEEKEEQKNHPKEHVLVKTNNIDNN